MPGPVALVGGAEFMPGNEEQDRLLIDAAAGRPAYVVCAAIRERPDRAATTAQRWFATLGATMTELPVRSRGDAAAADTAKAARAAGLVYLAGGDPGRLVTLLRDTSVWNAIAAAWAGGAALAGSSAGAMALCAWTLVRDRWPGHDTRRPVAALEVVPDSAVLPHFDTFGERWIPSAQAALGADVPLLGIDERTAAVWQDGTWTVHGPGSVTVVRGGDRERAEAGSAVTGIPQPVEPTSSGARSSDP